MKLAHLADLHLGFRQYTRQNSSGINQREADVASVFRSAIDQVIDAAPQIVVVAGDVFHSVRPANPAILDSFNQLRRLRAGLPDAPIVIIAGNHDTPRSVETGTILTLFEAIPNVHVISQNVKTLRFEDMDLSVTGYPCASLATPERPVVRPERGLKWNVLVLHGEVAGVVPGDRSFMDHTGAVIEPGDLHADRWSYVALGHYHVATEVKPNVWYAGSLEYVSTNPWAETHAGSGPVPSGAKGWLLVTLTDTGVAIDFKPVKLSRRHIDLDPIYASGMTASELDAALTERVARVAGGIEDQVIRQMVYDVSRSVGRELNHDVIRSWKTRALHYRLDMRRPQSAPTVGIAATGRRQTLEEIVDEYLHKIPTTPGVDREALIALGKEYLGRTERGIVEG